MPRRYRTRRQRSSRYTEYESLASYPRRRRKGCLSAITRFFYRVLIAFLLIGASILAGVVLFWAIFHFATFVQYLIYALYVGAAFLLLGIVYLLIRLFAAISRRLSAASLARSKAKMEREKVKQSHIQTQVQQVKLARAGSAPRRILEPGQNTYRPLPRPSFHHEREPRPPVQGIPNQQETTQTAIEPVPLVIPGMPAKGQVFRYRDYHHRLRPGQLIAGIREDGTPSIRSWDDFKILLIVGASSSGKTTTIVEKCVCAAQMGGRLVICDPHAIKPDSLTRRILPLQPSLLPGTSMAMEHPDIMRNIGAVHRELERRRRGASIEVPIFLVIEELNRLMRDKAIATELSTFLEELGQEARGYNIYAIVCAQRVTRLADIRNSVIACICHKVSPMESSKCLPARYAKYSGELGIGQTFVYDADGTVEPLQQVLITEEDVRRSVRQYQQVTTKHPPRQSEQVAPRVSEAPIRQPQQVRVPAPPPSLQEPPASPKPASPRRTSPLPSERAVQPAEKGPITEDLVQHPPSLRRTSPFTAQQDQFEVLALQRSKKRRAQSP